MNKWSVLHGDCRQQLQTLDACTIDSVVTDPPYEIGFLGRGWDKAGAAFDPGLWAEVLRVTKPGGHLLAFSGTRTYHRMVTAIEDAGWQIRDQLAWVYSSGFPKSLNVQKAVESSSGKPSPEWEGWGTALKPAWEPIVLARKPLSGQTVAGNVMQWGTGALNVNGCRVPYASDRDKGHMMKAKWHVNPSHVRDDSPGFVSSNKAGDILDGADFTHPLGRWPGNILHDGSQMVLDLFPGTGDQSAARFFYCPKASKQERELGLDGLDDRILNRTNPGGMEHDPKWAPRIRKNNHPTVKPVALMQYLVRMVTPPGGTVLDPFTGSGSTGVAALQLGHQFVGCELNEEYLDIIHARLGAV